MCQHMIILPPHTIASTCYLQPIFCLPAACFPLHHHDPVSRPVDVMGLLIRREVQVVLVEEAEVPQRDLPPRVRQLAHVREGHGAAGAHVHVLARLVHADLRPDHLHQVPHHARQLGIGAQLHHGPAGELVLQHEVEVTALARVEILEKVHGVRLVHRRHHVGRHLGIAPDVLQVQQRAHGVGVSLLMVESGGLQDDRRVAFPSRSRPLQVARAGGRPLGPLELDKCVVRGQALRARGAEDGDDGAVISPLG
mmetsp:Transcript_56721/g.179252  ORF Transcript_56721/g.179252 Transcript_56721/m.179252 type:complete len:252 (-) Transcript_56721:2503-3258(-)